MGQSSATLTRGAARLDLSRFAGEVYGNHKG